MPLNSADVGCFYRMEDGAMAYVQSQYTAADGHTRLHVIHKKAFGHISSDDVPLVTFMRNGQSPYLPIGPLDEAIAGFPPADL